MQSLLAIVTLCKPKQVNSWKVSSPEEGKIGRHAGVQAAKASAGAMCTLRNIPPFNGKTCNKASATHIHELQSAG
jgi:hypothetical protein